MKGFNKKKATPKRRGRPATGKDPSRTFRLSERFMADLDAWAVAQTDRPCRSEAIRRLVEIGLKKTALREAKVDRHVAEKAVESIERSSVALSRIGKPKG